MKVKKWPGTAATVPGNKRMISYVNQNTTKGEELQGSNYLFLELDDLTQEAASLVDLQNAVAIAFSTGAIFRHALEFLAMLLQDHRKKLEKLTELVQKQKDI